jgi:NOL1/NOP2/fmu family ribosome biogenesis protein
MRRRGTSEVISPPGTKEKVFGYLEERFGLERSLFDDYGLYMASKGRVYLGPRRVPDLPKIATIGLLIARVHGTVKPSTNLLQALGKRVSRNIVNATREQALAYARGGDFKPDSAAVDGIGDGYVLVRFEGASLGCGLLQKGMVKNMLPKAKRLELRYI